MERFKRYENVVSPSTRYGKAKEKYQVVWSEEDDKTIREACCYLDEYGNWMPNKDKATSIYKTSNKLRALQPVNNSNDYINKAELLKCIQSLRSIPHDNAIPRDLALQEVVNIINAM